MEPPAGYAEFPQVHGGDTAHGGRAIWEIRQLQCAASVCADAVML
jgi:hypothetical protein